MTVTIDTVGPAAFILKGITDALKQQVPNLYPLYDPDLSYERVQGGYRAMRAGNKIPGTPRNPEDPKPSAWPIFGFNRSPIKYNSVMQKRAVTQAVGVADDLGQQVNFHAFFGEMMITFAFFCDSPAMLEKWETAYLAKAAISNLRTFTINLPVIGEVTYDVEWGELDSILSSKDPVEYNAFTGMCRVTGLFIALTETENRIIDRIIVDVRNWSAEHIYYRTTKLPGQPPTTVEGADIPPNEYDRPDEPLG